MNRYFDFLDGRMTLCVGVTPGSPAALAKPERIRVYFMRKGAVHEIDGTEYTRLTDIYTWFDRSPEATQAGEGGHDG